MTQATTPTIEELRERFAAHGQEHVFRFWDRLDPAARARLTRQAAQIAAQLEELVEARRRAVAELGSSAPRKLEPIDAITLPEYGGDPARFEAARQRGEALLGEARVAPFVVAGGQGTRLGFDGPKGGFPVGPVTDRTLFQIQAEKIRGLARRIGQRVPWYVMTSHATDAATREFLRRADYFGLPAEDVFVFPQDSVPAFDFEGRLILEAPDRIFESPNGHGGSLTALVSSGAVDDMERRGIDTIFYYQVDNPLIRIADPVYVGFHHEAGAEMSCKVVRKHDPDEKWGVLARSEGRITVVEYTELDDEHRHARDPEGRLVYWAGNVGIHLLRTGFVRRVAGRAREVLPFHASAKKIPHVDAEGSPVAPREPNGHKLERFVFDALPAAEGVCVVEAAAEREFSPIKNAEGKESPATARRDLVAVYRSWLAAAGVDPPPPDQAVEIDHSRIDSAEEAEAFGLRSLHDAGDVVRVGLGRDA